MAQIILKPNGLFAIWSNVVDDFIVDDTPADGVMAYFIQEAVDETSRRVGRDLENLRVDRNPLGIGPKTWEEACALRDEMAKANKP